MKNNVSNLPTTQAEWLHLAYLKHQYDLIKFEILHFQARINLIEEHYNFIVDNEECFMSAHQVKKYLAKRLDEINWVEVKITLLREELERIEIQQEAGVVSYLDSLQQLQK